MSTANKLDAALQADLEARVKLEKERLEKTQRATSATSIASILPRIALGREEATTTSTQPIETLTGGNSCEFELLAGDTNGDVLDLAEFDRQCREVSARELAADEAERKKRSLDAMMGRAAIPPRFVNRSLRNYTADTDGQKRALSVCQRYAATFAKPGGAKESGTCLILAGNPGTGKTHLAAGVANYLLENGSTAVYSTAMTAIRAIRETWQNKTGKTESQVIQDFVKPDLLILDEIGVQHGTEAEKLHLFDLINARYEAVRPTLIISNLELDAVEQFIGERAFDRLREGGGKAVSFDWGSSRKRMVS